MVNENEFDFTLPRIFSDAKLDWLVYAETRRSGTGSLPGNLAERDSILNRENFSLLDEEGSFEDWVAREAALVKSRIDYLRSKMSVVEIGLPFPVHEASIINLDEDIADVLQSVDSTKRAPADVTILTQPGYASCFSPADCPIINIVDPTSRTVLQIHAGYRGLEQDIIRKTFKACPGISIGDALIWIAPHASKGYTVYGPTLDRLMSNPSISPFIQVQGEEGHFDMTQLVVEQLTALGIPENHIEVSPRNSLTDPELYSQRMHQQKKANGRNGVIIGIKSSIKDNPERPCPPEIIRHIKPVGVRYIDFDQKIRHDIIEIHEELVPDVEAFFNEALELRFPIEKVVQSSNDEFKWDDDALMAANTTSGFNYRLIKDTDKPSLHGLGRAFDVNCRLNPFIRYDSKEATYIVEPSGASYDKDMPGTLTSTHPLVALMKDRGWEWGGDWTKESGRTDYQHFQKPPN